MKKLFLLPVGVLSEGMQQRAGLLQIFKSEVKNIKSLIEMFSKAIGPLELHIFCKPEALGASNWRAVHRRNAIFATKTFVLQ